jgi:hypothetical protein
MGRADAARSVRRISSATAKIPTIMKFVGRKRADHDVNFMIAQEGFGTAHQK